MLIWIWKTLRKITCAYLDLNDRVTLTLAVREFPSPHTGARIKDLMLQILDDFLLRGKISYVTADNGSNIVKVIMGLVLALNSIF